MKRHPHTIQREQRSMHRSRHLLNAHDRHPRRAIAPDEAPRQQGVIGQITRIIHDKGFGFLVANGQEYFFHRQGFVRSADFDQILAGSYVRFEPTRGPKGLRAEHLELA